MLHTLNVLIIYRVQQCDDNNHNKNVSLSLGDYNTMEMFLFPLYSLFKDLILGPRLSRKIYPFSTVVMLHFQIPDIKAVMLLMGRK